MTEAHGAKGTWPLVGRSRELELIDSAYADRARRGGWCWSASRARAGPGWRTRR